jgi:hypothetical protein
VVEQDLGHDHPHERVGVLLAIARQQADIIRAMDPEVAVGFWLDLCGSRVGEPRGGLSDAEYLRIILGRQSAAFALGTVPGVWACWLALTGATEDRARMYRVPAFGLPTVYLEAEVTTAPSSSTEALSKPPPKTETSVPPVKGP